jgi:hypothetical protein
MTGEQRDELSRLRMKAASPEMVTVPRVLLAEVLAAAQKSNAHATMACIALNPDDESGYREMEAAELARIAKLRASAGIE